MDRLVRGLDEDNLYEVTKDLSQSRMKRFLISVHFANLTTVAQHGFDTTIPAEPGQHGCHFSKGRP